MISYPIKRFSDHYRVRMYLNKHPKYYAKNTCQTFSPFTSMCNASHSGANLTINFGLHKFLHQKNLRRILKILK